MDASLAANLGIFLDDECHERNPAQYPFPGLHFSPALQLTPGHPSHSHHHCRLLLLLSPDDVSCSGILLKKQHTRLFFFLHHLEWNWLSFSPLASWPLPDTFTSMWGYQHLLSSKSSEVVISDASQRFRSQTRVEVTKCFQTIGTFKRLLKPYFFSLASWTSWLHIPLFSVPCLFDVIICIVKTTVFLNVL